MPFLTPLSSLPLADLPLYFTSTFQPRTAIQYSGQHLRYNFDINGISSTLFNHFDQYSTVIMPVNWDAQKDQFLLLQIIADKSINISKAHYDNILAAWRKSFRVFETSLLPLS